jgi:hypothetical protein
MKISAGFQNRVRVFFEGNLPTALDYLFNPNDGCSPPPAILTPTHKNNRGKDLASRQTKGHALKAFSVSNIA